MLVTDMYLDGKKVKRLRTLKGMTLRDLAAHSGLSANAIHAIEARGRNPRFKPPTLLKLATALGVETIDLVGEDDEE